MRFLGLVIALTVGGCGLFGDNSTNNTVNTAGPVGFGKPTLELTISGIHYGPAAPDASSSATLRNSHNALTETVTQSEFTVTALIPGAASCQFGVQRFGDDISPIGVGAYEISSATDTFATAVVPIGAQTVQTAQDGWQCSGSGCDGSTLSITHLDADHVEGYLTGTFSNAATAVDVVCSFYVPTQVFAP